MVIYVRGKKKIKVFHFTEKDDNDLKELKQFEDRFEQEKEDFD